MRDDDVARRARRAAQRHDARVVRLLGAGSDHEAYALDDGAVMRVRKQPSPEVAEEVEREAQLLGVVAAASPLPTPVVVFAEPDEGVIALRRLPGTPLLDAPCPRPEVLVDQLGSFLDTIHRLPLGLVEGVVPTEVEEPVEYLAEAVALYPAVAHVVPLATRPHVEGFLASAPPRPTGATSFCHGDLGAEHLLATPDPWTITGVIDWSDAAITDPARDLGRLHRDLGPAVTGLLADRLDHVHDDTLARAVFHARCALIEDLAYGLDAGDQRYVDAALASLGRTFGP